MKLKVIDPKGEKDKSVDLPDKLFNIEPNEGVIYRAIHNELANKRLGTASTKDRSLVKGSTKKPWRQKGTGRARAGSVKSPIWRGGGTVFGPKIKDYGYSLPKKVKQLSIRSILSKRHKEKRLQVIDNVIVKKGETKEVREQLFSMSLMKNDFGELKNNKLRKKMRNYNLTIITDDDKSLLRRSCRNLPWVKCLNYNRLNSYDLFYSHEIMIEAGVLSKLEDLYLKRTQS